MKWWAGGALVALIMAVVPAAAGAGPLFDPWLERFQVGAAGLAAGLEDGYPTGLLEPAHVDTAWVRAARRCLDPGRSPVPGADLTRRWLAARDPAAADAQLRAMAAALVAFADTTADPGLAAGAAGAAGDAILAGELGARRFFAALAAGDLARARTEAATLAARRGPGLEPRENFVWGLRARRVARLGGGPASESATIWDEALPLPSWDAANAWALWVGHCRQRGQSPIAPPEATAAWRAWLASVGRGGDIAPVDLIASGLPEPWRAAVGAAVLPKTELAAHFRRHPTPPADYDLQGMWVNGRRTARQGDAAAYEEIAATPGLAPNWQLDLWRRAAELRLLDGQPSRARTDLDRALALAREGHGTTATRRRLRQWVEQAMVLAITRADYAAARSLRDAGRAALGSQELEVFRDEIRQWEPRLGGAAAAPDTVEITQRAAWIVAAGKAPAIRPATAAVRERFAAAADRPLWELWVRWGGSFTGGAADTSAGSSAAPTRAGAYARRLATVPGSAEPAAAVLAAVAPLLGEPRLGGQLLDADVVRLTGAATPARPSLVPALVTAAGDDHLAIHALLGFALAAGDMRGVLAAATMLPQRGLTAGERRAFLYPLPWPGPVRDALLDADNDPALILAVARNESLFEPGVRSWAGALGFMQVMPFHYERRGALPGPRHWSNPPVSIGKGDALLSDGARRYGGDPYRALAGYNAGYEATDRWDRQLGGKAARDVYLAWIGYPETRHYVEKVLIDREIYRSVIADRADARD